MTNNTLPPENDAAPAENGAANPAAEVAGSARSDAAASEPPQGDAPGLGARRRTLIIVVAVLALLGLAAAVLVPLWLARSSATDAARSATPAASGPGSLAWSSDLGAESWGTPVIAGDLVIVGANDGVVSAFTHANGNKVWSFDTGGEVRNGALVSDDAIFVTSDSGTVFALDHAGTKLWSVDTGTGPVRNTWDNFGSKPALLDGTLFVGTAEGRLLALSANDGSEKWAYTVGAPVRTDITTGDGRVYAIDRSGFAHAVDAASGNPIWTALLGAAGTTAPGFSDGVLVVGSRALRVQGLDAASGEELWRSSYGASWVQSGATIVGDRVTIGSSDIGEVRQLNLVTGEAEWVAKIGGWPWGVPAYADDVYYASNLSTESMKPWKASLFALDGTSGEVLWTAGTGAALEWKPGSEAMSGIAGSPVVSDDLVIVAGLDGVLSAFRR